MYSDVLHHSTWSKMEHLQSNILFGINVGFCFITDKVQMWSCLSFDISPLNKNAEKCEY